MHTEILSILAERMASHMPNFIARLAFPDEKIMERVRISQTGASVAGIYIPPESSIIRMTLQIRNSLPCLVDLDSIHGEVQAIDYILIDNFTKPLNEKLKGHLDKDFPITLDLPDSKAKIVGNHRADNFDFLLNGKLVFYALGRRLAKPIKVRVNAVIHGLHGTTS